MKEWLKKLFCKHEWGYRRKIQMFYVLNGDTYEIVCKKCGKIKGEYFQRYD